MVEKGPTGLCILGEKTPILFIHGMWEGTWVFSHWMQRVAAQGHSVYSVELRGHDTDTKCNIGKVSIKDYVYDVERTLSYIHLTTGQLPVVVGHSMGGLIAQIVSSGELVHKAAFVTSAPSREVWLRGPVIKTLLSSRTYIEAVLKGKPLEISFKDARNLELNNMSESLAQLVHGSMVPESGTAARQMVTWQVSAPKARCETLVISGGKDRMTIDTVQRKIADHHGSQYEYYSDNGHMLMLENGWENPIDRILRFIQ